MKYKHVSVLSNKKVKASLKCHLVGLGAGGTSLNTLSYTATLTTLRAFIALFLECLTILI